jgi:hypothetical protein
MSQNRAFTLLSFFIFAALAVGAKEAASQSVSSAPTPVSKTASVAAQQAAFPLHAEPLHRVVLVSVDGLHVALVKRMPNLKRMFKDGAGTMQAEVPYGSTTAISHAALFTGAQALVNGVDCEPDEPKCQKKFRYHKNQGYHSPGFRWTPLQVKDTLFSAVESLGYKAVAAVQKGKLVGMFRQDGNEKGIISTNDTRKVVATACAAVKDIDIRLVVLHFKMIDDVGHHWRTGGGWLSEPQYKEAEIIDGQLQQVRDCIDRANAGDAYVMTDLIVTGDHGGTPGYSHGQDNDDNRFVPWVAVGPGIKQGLKIVGRNDLTPIKGGVIKPTILLIDSVPTILHMLGISESAIPTLSITAKPVDGIYVQTSQ